jgi:hypothetical protein
MKRHVIQKLTPTGWEDIETQEFFELDYTYDWQKRLGKLKLDSPSNAFRYVIRGDRVIYTTS